MWTAIINERAARRVRSGHPWVYRSDLVSVIEDGSLSEAARVQATTAMTDDNAPESVGVRDARGRVLGVADYSAHSQIALRFLTFQHDAHLDRAFFRERLQAAVDYRRAVVENSDAYRLVWGEADGLPGLIVDRYGEALVYQTLTAAMDRRQQLLLELLDELLHPATLVERNDARVRRLEKLETRSLVVRGTAEVEARIAGLRYRFDLLAGQKTGGFLDQRENWAAAAEFATRFGAIGEALDTFTYQGGFALPLARVCRHVEGVDSSRPALERAEQNAALNGLTNVDWIEANVFDLLRDYDSSGRRFHTVVLDPPAFAKSGRDVDAAERGYKELNLRALKLLHAGGILVTCSCSYHFSEAALLAVLAEAAIDARRRVTVLERRSQSLDHPVLLSVPETQYLKCLVVHVT